MRDRYLVLIVALILALVLPSAASAQLPPTVLNTASAVYGNGVGGSAQQVNATGNALHVLVTGSSGTSDVNLTEVGSNPVATAATGQLQVGLYAQSSTPGDTALLTGDTNNATSAVGSLKTAPIARYNATLPTLTDTRYNQLQVGLRGGLQTNLYAANSTNGIVQSDPVGNALTNGTLAVGSHLFDASSSQFFAMRSARSATTDTETGSQAVQTSQMALTSAGTYARVRASAISPGVLLTSTENSWSNITTFASTAVKSSAGVIAAISVDSPALTGAIILNDAANCTSGTAQIQIASIAASTVAHQTVNARTANGICVVTTGTGTPSFTVYYR